ncbi:hypothetical protein RZN22_09595 [Bacillaceae bacterium S4-13-58]
MHQSHGIGYEEYSRKLDQRIKVEKRREMEYQKSLSYAADFERQAHR